MLELLEEDDDDDDDDDDDGPDDGLDWDCFCSYLAISSGLGSGSKTVIIFSELNSIRTCNLKDLIYART